MLQLANALSAIPHKFCRFARLLACYSTFSAWKRGINSLFAPFLLNWVALFNKNVGYKDAGTQTHLFVADPLVRPRTMRLATTSILITLILGAVLWCIGASMPVYTDSNAPERLSHELQDHPREVRFREWYSGLKSVETPHKKLTDVGRGLMAFALGMVLCVGVASLYQHFSGASRVTFVVISWSGLWALKIPFSGWYYGLRQKRFDFPVWGDSIAIPVMSETFIWIAGAVVSGLALLALMYRHRFSASLRPSMPIGVWAWTRALALGVWLLLILFCVASGIWDGDEGMVISCLGAIPLILAALSASPTIRPLHEATTTKPIEA